VGTATGNIFVFASDGRFLEKIPGSSSIGAIAVSPDPNNSYVIAANAAGMTINKVDIDLIPSDLRKEDNFVPPTTINEGEENNFSIYRKYEQEETLKQGSSSTSYALWALQIGIIGSGIINIDLGFSFIKLFQIIEILSKLLFIPVIYHTTMRNFLVLLHKIADPLGLPDETIVQDSFQSMMKYFLRKITVYEERTIIL
jgi:hypothetical protein